MKICAIIPAYNEEETIGEVIQETKRHVDTVFVVDNYCTDNTAAIVHENGAEVIHLTMKRGYGAAQYAGHTVAMEREFDYILQLDADGQHNPKYIPSLLDAMQSGDYDIVLGSRFLTDSYKNLPFIRKVGIRFFSKVVSFLGHTNITDVTSGFKVYRVNSLKRLSKPSDTHPAVEQMLEIARKGMKIKEVAIEMPVRNTGKSHLNLIRLALYPFRMVWPVTKVMLFRPGIKGARGNHWLTTSADKPRIGFIAGLSTFVDGVPQTEGPLRFLRVLEPLSDQIIWVAARGLNTENRISNKVVLVEIEWRDVHVKSFLNQTWYHLFQQIRITLKLLKIRKVDIVIFKSVDFYLLPILFARVLLKKKTIIISDGRPSIEAVRYVGRGKKYKLALFKIVEKVTYSLADRIVVYSYHSIDINNMQKYTNKIGVSAVASYVDSHLFMKTKELSLKKYDVGYVGRFSRKKGFLEFMQSLFSLLDNEPLKVVIIGGEPQDYEIQKLLLDVKVQNKAEVIDWVNPEELVQYLNDIKLLVIPSYGEGMPKLALEAMACGCIVVATPIGSIPEIVQDGKTGFILKNNSPNEITKGISRALVHADLNGIAQNARSLIEREYTYEVMLEKWRRILDNL